MASDEIINPNQIRHEIETLKSQKQEIEARISLLQSQLHQQQQYSSSTNESCPPISAVQGTQEEDKKLGEQAARITLKVKGLDGYEVFFRIKSSTQFKKLMNAYCDRRSVDLQAYYVKFFYEGRVVRADQTPDELEMKDGDEIDAVLNWPRCD